MVSTERMCVAREFTQVRYPHTHTTNTSDFLSVQCAEVDTSATHILLASTPTEVMCYISSKESPSYAESYPRANTHTTLSSCCRNMFLARLATQIKSKPCHHLINLTSDSPGARLAAPSLPPPQFQCWSRWFFLFSLVSPLSTLKFGGAGGNGAHQTSEVKNITGLYASQHNPAIS